MSPHAPTPWTLDSDRHSLYILLTYTCLLRIYPYFIDYTYAVLYSRRYKLFDKWQRDKSVTKRSCVIFRALVTRRYLAGHELNPNRGVTVSVRSHTACMSVCDLSISQSPNLRSSAAMYLLHWQHRRSRSAPSVRLSDQISTIKACGRRSRTE